jgi:hypothetical protein
MLEWLLAIPLWFSNAPAQQQDYVGMVAAEAAYAALLPDTTPVKPKVPRKDCKTCNGSGKVRQGDGHETECPDCDPTLGADIKLDIVAPAMKSSGFPPRQLRSAQ